MARHIGIQFFVKQFSSLRILAPFLFIGTLACSGGGEPTTPTVAAPLSETLLLEAVSPTEINGTVGELVDPVPAVIVKTPLGQPVPGMAVGFDIAGGVAFSGSITNSVSVTNAQGIATPGEWRLGTLMTSQGLIATLHADGPTRSVTFRVEAAPAAPTQLRAYWTANQQQVGLPDWQINAPAIWLADKFGNRVPVGGVLVSFAVTAGGGQLSKTQVQTDANGYASAESWTLGPSAGLNSVVASVANLDGVTFTAQALDARAFTWYDLDSVDNRSTQINSGSIGLSKNGYFVEEALYGEADRRWLGGKYTVTGPQIYFEQYTGTDGEPYGWSEIYSEGQSHTLVDDRLSIVWCPPWYDCGWATPPAEELRVYSKRKGQ